MSRVLIVASALLSGVTVAHEARASSFSPVNEAVAQIQKYCGTSWRNSGIPRSEWSDCTQQVFVELLRVVPARRLNGVFLSADAEERRELERAIWRIAKRTARAHDRRPASLPAVVGTARRPIAPDGDGDTVDDILDLAEQSLSGRQRDIIRRLIGGATIGDIAEALDISRARVSDEKYRAIVRLREIVQCDGAADASRGPVEI